MPSERTQKDRRVGSLAQKSRCLWAEVVTDKESQGWHSDIEGAKQRRKSVGSAEIIAVIGAQVVCSRNSMLCFEVVVCGAIVNARQKSRGDIGRVEASGSPRGV